MSLEEIKDVLKDNLEKRGVLNKIRANLRAEIFKTFEDQDHDESTEFWLKKQTAKPKPSDVQFLINELFIEYLEYNQMDYTKSVFQKECNQPEERLDKKFLSHELNIRKTYDDIENDDDGDSIPLLYTIVHRLRYENVREKRKDLSNDEESRSKRVNSQHNQKPILHIGPNHAREEMERIRRGNLVPNQTTNHMNNQPRMPISQYSDRPQSAKQREPKRIDLSSSLISSDSSNGNVSVDNALSKIIQQNYKLSQLQKRSSPPKVSTGLERKEILTAPKSSRMFNVNKFELNNKNFDSDNSCVSSSDFSLAPNEKRISTGIPQFSSRPFKGDDSTLDDTIELVYKR